MKCQHYVKLAGVCIALITCAMSLLMPATAAACITGQQSCSTTYGVSQTHFGSGGQINACSHGSTGYCANESAGDLTDGGAKDPSNAYQTQTGSGLVINRNPSLTLIVNNPNADLGYLSTGSAATTTATFSVKTYLASGYIVQTVGNPPTSNGPSPHILKAINAANGFSTPQSSSPGTEQFGMNLVNVAAFCNPAGFCATPTIPTNYDTSNKYYYNNGDTIASANQSTGEVDFTISYLFNISTTTPDGQYTFNQSIVATSTF